MMAVPMTPKEYVKSMGPLFPGKIIRIPKGMSLMEVSGAMTKLLQEQNSGAELANWQEAQDGFMSQIVTTSSQE